MLTRRHIRVKVMQSIYAFGQSANENLNAEEKFLQKSMQEMYDLFLLNLDLLVKIKDKAEDFLTKSQKKYLATEEDKNPNLKFVNNRVIQQIEKTEKLSQLLEDRKLTNWSRDEEYVAILWEAVKTSQHYNDYLATRESNYKEDKNFIITIFKEVIAPNEKLYDYLEDRKLTWLDDLPIVNTGLLKLLQRAKASYEQFEIPRLFKSQEDKDFASELFKKTLLNEQAFMEDVSEKTPKWDKERIAEIDAILLKMAICEFLKFPSIPVKVSINEYLEIAKEYSTPKSSIFINGILDKLSKEYKENGKLNKMGRGLM
ncbi:transcription antitermination factor NusB [Haloflavibacter putidus]|uniref:Transcription antitermination factor NusB n=1 Tax=Haloflavibacter putidus TaxID=2576776 RepID=A0A507ZQ26_9FLAO|nr:transcription antitermination factor NusB [Haloflavibacter putidus]TQD38613.1 transcription antitermination factor NusB [Haloflavibacter putidus]